MAKQGTHNTAGKLLVVVITMLLLFMAILIALSNSGIGQNLVSERVDYLIGISQSNLTEPWRINMTEELQEGFASYKNINTIVTDASASTEKQIEDVDMLLSVGIDLLIISPNDSRRLTPILSQVYKDIPVIVLDRAVEGYDYTLYIGPDNEDIGLQAGRMVVEEFGDHPCKIVEINGYSDSPPSINRSSGFASAIEEYQDIEVIKQISGRWLRDIAEDQMADVLSLYNDIDVVFAHNDDMAYGAYLAYKKSGYKKEIKFIGADGFLEGNVVPLIQSGEFAGTFVCPTGGKEAAQYAVEILRKNNNIPKKVILRSFALDQENLDAYIREMNAAGTDYQGRAMRLGFCNVGREGDWRKANANSIISAATDYGVDIVYQEADLTQETQKEIIREFIEQKMDVIAFAPIVETGWEDVLLEAKQAGIPVIVTDRRVSTDDPSLVSCFIGSDFLEEGRRAARWIIEQTADRDNVRIAEIGGPENTTPTVYRRQGFQQEFVEKERYSIVAGATGDWTVQSGKDCMNRMLDETEQIDVVFCYNDDMALGAIEAVKERGFTPGEDILFVSIDGTAGALRSIVKGELGCSVECNPLLGPLLMQSVLDIQNGKELPVSVISSEGVFTEANVKQSLPLRKY